jgi:hypothetical protein
MALFLCSCGPGTYIFPNLLLRNSLGQFVDFGKVFMKLSELLEPYKECVEPFTVVSENSLCQSIQDLAYWTEYPTSFVFSLEDNGIITGLHRHARVSASSGVGYSDCSDCTTTVEIDTTYTDKLTECMTNISDKFGPRVADTPLLGLLGFIVMELSTEEVLQKPQYSTAVFSLFAQLQAAGHANAADESVLLKLLELKTVLGDDYGLDRVIIPEGIEVLGRSSGSVKEGLKMSSGDEVGEPAESPLEAVTLVENFKSHQYAHGGSFGTLSQSAATMSAALMRRMRIELSTLRSSLPASIRFMTLETNYSFCKFLISGPVDTPYEGGFFLFDMSLPMDYPASSPAVTFLTTGGGAVRFNPNLYNCGKVCLSLLGTWSGEAW